MRQRKKQAVPSRKQELSSTFYLIERLHPSLRANFVPLPKAGEILTDEQLAEIFGGDLDALRDVVRLIRRQVPK